MVSKPQTATSDLLEQYADVIRLGWLIRKTEQRLLELFKQGKLFGTVHTCIGQEFVGIAVARALHPQDNVFSNHRCHGHFLAYRQNLVGLIGEIMGKSVGVCGGRGGSQHLHQGSFYSNGVQGSIVPVCAGLAYSQKVKATNGITVAFLGDGTLGEGAVYEAMNIASKWELPVLFVCENNLYAQSTHQSQTLAGGIRARAEAFGIETAYSDTWNWPALLQRHSRQRGPGQKDIEAAISPGRHLPIDGPLQGRRQPAGERGRALLGARSHRDAFRAIRVGPALPGDGPRGRAID